VLGAFRRLRCIAEDGRYWVWLYRDEALSLSFERAHAELPSEVHPIVIGRFRLPEQGSATLEVRSVQRAIQAARFFQPRFGSRVVLRRIRLVNRFFAGSEAPRGGALEPLLDEDVTILNPEEEIAKLRALVSAPEGKRLSPLETAKRLMAHLEGRELPLVEDLPVNCEDMTGDFGQLNGALQLRFMLAHERWEGSRVTAVQLINRMLGG
jgi:hypothetical protein